ncbi:MAG: peptide deformylase [Alphaproteobacteria bacterium]
MALRDIITIPDARLKRVSDPVGPITPDVRALVDDMFETMYLAPGIGLAAIQIAVPKRVITIDIARKEEPKQPIVLIDPEITWLSDEIATYEEGCLSIPEYYELVDRPARCSVRYRDLDNNVIERMCDGLLATCVQHELDHLNGVLFIDHISRLKRERLWKKVVKAAKREGTA